MMKYLVLISLALLSAMHNVSACSTDEQGLEKAKQIWEQAIIAKGGRERLLNINNLLIVDNKTHSVSLDVFPDKNWVWAVDAKPIGTNVISENYATGIAYRIKSDKVPDSFKLNPARMTWHLASLLELLLETKWVKPKILGYDTTKINGRDFDVVCTQITSDAIWDRDFIFDQTTHLLVRTITPSKDDGSGFRLITNYKDYIEVKGIKLAQKVVGKFENGHSWIDWNSTYQIDVEYKKDLFDGPPRIADGPNGWMEKKPDEKKSRAKTEKPTNKDE